MRRMVHIVRWLLVVVGVILLTSFTVDATIGGGGFSQSALGILARNIEDRTAGGCPEGMIRLGGDFSRVCVDRYEVSPGLNCPEKTTVSSVATSRNIATSACLPESQKGMHPWTFVTQYQAQELCARAKKRLLSNAEWYRATLGTPDAVTPAACVIESDTLQPAGTKEMCVSGVGAYDMVGNAWEWVDGGVTDNHYADRALPNSGYVAEADLDGVVTKTSEVPDDAFKQDYFWTTETGAYGMLRGGSHGSREDAGVFSLQAKTPLSFAGGSVGFRCAFDLAS